MNREAHTSDYTGETQDAARRRLDHLHLMQRVAQGDQGAFATLYEHFSTQIYTYLVHIVRDEAAAEDLIQEVFLALWTGAGRFRGQSMVKTWLFQVAHHKAVSWLRRNGNRNKVNLFNLRSSEPTPEDTTVQTLNQEQVQAALLQMPVEQRAVVELAVYHELPYAEIAKVLGCPVGTVKSRMSFARKNLMGALKGKGFE